MNNMNKFLELLDGTGKEPRQIQVDYLNHLESKLGTHNIHIMEGPPGVGKSFLARTIQRRFSPNCAILTNNNLLVDQYTETYPELNGVKGKDFYPSKGEYIRARKLADEKDSVFNPLSFYYYHLLKRRREGITNKPSVVIIDEAHRLADMLLLTIDQSLPCHYYKIPKNLDDKGFLKWLKTYTEKLEKFHGSETKVGAKLSAQYEKLKIMYDYLKDNLANVKTFYEMKENSKGIEQLHMCIRPIELPVGLLDTIFEGARMILFSGSFTRMHARELFPDTEVDYVQYEPLAPKENMPILYRPINKVDRNNIKVIAQTIRNIYINEGRPNTLVHVTYGASMQLAMELKDLNPITHTKEDKIEKVEEFKQRGGIMLGCGMAEGVDLPGDYCRLLIIPKLLYPNKGDQAVAKRLALPNGNEWYSIETAMTTVQQLGRGVRGQHDACTSYILDYTFPFLMKNVEPYLTNGLKAAIQWSNN